MTAWFPYFPPPPTTSQPRQSRACRDRYLSTCLPTYLPTYLPLSTYLGSRSLSILSKMALGFATKRLGKELQKVRVGLLHAENESAVAVMHD